MGKWTTTQLAVAVAWLDEVEKHPTKDQHYLMRIAQRVMQGWVKKASRVTLKQQLLKFEGDQKKAEKKMTPEQRIAMSKSKWFRTTGYKGVAQPPRGPKD